MPKVPRTSDTDTPTPAAERSLQAAMAANVGWAKTPDRTARTAPGRAAMDARFLEMADGDPVRAASFRKAHFQNLALKSARARRKAKELTAQAEAAERELADENGEAP